MKKFFDELKSYAENNTDIECILVVGSYARGTNTEVSDIDIVMITTNKKTMLEKQDFIHEFGIVCKKQIEDYGPCTSIRVFYQDGKEVEFGLVEPSWISLPLDPGTDQVLSDGYQILIDKQDYFKFNPQNSPL